MKLSLVKKIHLMWLCAMFAILTGCNNNSSSPAPLAKPTVAETTLPDSTKGKAYYYVKFARDMPCIAHITITYTGADGNELTEATTGKCWTKEIPDIALPFHARLRVSIERKEDFVATKKRYEVGGWYDIRLTRPASIGEKQKLRSNKHIMTIKADKVEEYIADNQNKPLEVTLQLD